MRFYMDVHQYLTVQFLPVQQPSSGFPPTEYRNIKSNECINTHRISFKKDRRNQSLSQSDNESINNLKDAEQSMNPSVKFYQS